MKQTIFLIVLAIATFVPLYIDVYDILCRLVHISLTVAETFDELVNAPPELRESYEFIVIGAGTAGCVLANRLAASNPKWHVLLVEAGGEETLPMAVPSMVHFLQMYEPINWRFRSRRSATRAYCVSMVDGRCKFPRGRVMGGSSVLNYMIYSRGNRRDFDEWARLGNDGWSYDDVLPYFQRAEASTIPGAVENSAGTDGPVTISFVDYLSEAGRIFYDALIGMGLPTVNYNGREQAGISLIQTTTKKGMRVSSNRAYLNAATRKRLPNLHILPRNRVIRIKVEHGMAVGIRLENGGRARASKEVVLCAGAIGSPHLLMLSGIGPAEHLRERKIRPLNMDLPGVGENFMDHVSPGLYHFTTNATTPSVDAKRPQSFWHYFNSASGPIASPAGCESIAFVNSMNVTESGDDIYPDLELLGVSGALHDFSGIATNLGLQPNVAKSLYRAPASAAGQNMFSISPMTLRPRSRGRITLRDNLPQSHPIIQPNYFEDPYDLEVAIRGIRLIHRLEKEPAFKRANARLLRSTVPECEQKHAYGTDQFWECHARHLTFTIYHYAGTCKMGPATDKMAVVDATLRVHGLRGLRVADASVMPTIVSGHPNAAVFMIGEKAAQMIIDYWR